MQQKFSQGPFKRLILFLEKFFLNEGSDEDVVVDENSDHQQQESDWLKIKMLLMQ